MTLSFQSHTWYIAASGSVVSGFCAASTNNCNKERGIIGSFNDIKNFLMQLVTTATSYFAKRGGPPARLN